MRTSTPGIGSPTVSEPFALRPREGDDRPHLGGPVALEDVDAHVGPALGELDVQRRGADADRVEASRRTRREDRRKRIRRSVLGQRPGDGVEALEGRPRRPAWSTRRSIAASSSRSPWGTMSSIDTPKSRKVRTSTVGWRLTG